MTMIQAAGNDAGAALFAALNGTAAGNASGTADLQNRFLTLLTAQIRNQDPLNPLDNSQMTSQLAQISTVDGIERLNATLQALMLSSMQTGALQAAGLVGHRVFVPGDTLRLDGQPVTGAVELAGRADSLRIKIKDAEGNVVRTLELKDLAEGNHTFEWDGKTDSGAQARDGKYTFSVEAKRNGADVAAGPLLTGLVTGIVRTVRGVLLNVGTLGAFTLDDIRQIN